ncbi:MAG: nucleoside kinase [Lachnospiraceae bacterium]|nr:nucleoside kinase [Candidatus Equihabitans merdae]
MGNEIMAKVIINGNKTSYPFGTTLKAIADEYQPTMERDILLARVNGYLKELHHTIQGDCQIEFLTIEDQAGFATYRRSCSMLFMAALYQVAGYQKVDKVMLHFGVADGYYYTVDGIDTTTELIARVEERMQEMVAAKTPIVKKQLTKAKALEQFRKHRMYDKECLFKTRISSGVNMYYLGDYEDYFYGFMTCHTGYLKLFKLYPYAEGILLQMPSISNPDKLEEVNYSEKVFRRQLAGEEWAKTLNIPTVGYLNRRIINQDTRELILAAEALQESRLTEIADMIAARPQVKFVMMAGPSSSGKTTTSQRLIIQLMARGLRPHYIGVDNYFKNRADTPLLPNGQKDYESLNAVDVEGFNSDMLRLLKGEEVPMPTYDFLEGTRVYKGDTIKLGPKDLLVIEGIHCLNDQLSTALPQESKFKIYLSALAQLNLDEHNYVKSSDGRLMRRIIRDNRTRGHSASKTLAMWSTVRKGEEDHIFPYQDSADVVFNSALPYELAVLKQYIQPLLFQIEPGDPMFDEANRLLKFLDYVIGMPSDDVPTNSILREFIGGGCFRL